MAHISSDAIICRFTPDANQWLAYFAGAPQVGFGGDLPMRAVRRLLEGTEAARHIYPLRCDSDQARNSVLHRHLIWDPPEMLFECSSCRGTGQYVGLAEVGTCKVCRGRKVVAW